MKHEANFFYRKGQFVAREHNWLCTCGVQGKWRENILKARGLFDVHVREEDEKEKNPDVARVQALRRSGAAGPVKRDKPRTTEKQALKLEWF